MLEIYQRFSADPTSDSPLTVDDSVVLDHGQREKGRFKAVSEKQEELRFFLERGNTLRIGEILHSECGRKIAVVGAKEPVAIATSSDWETFSKACYHLGNRHVKLQVGKLVLKITPDYVLEDMLRRLGLNVFHDDAVFEPESGAYSKGHSHSEKPDVAHSQLTSDDPFRSKKPSHTQDVFDNGNDSESVSEGSVNVDHQH